jgi:hypothetical protein
MRELEEGIELIEPIACPAVYCSGVARAFVKDGEVHLLWFVEQPGVTGIERVVNLRTVMRIEAFPEARALVDEALKAWRRALNS